MSLSKRGQLYTQSPEWLEPLMSCIAEASLPCEDESQRIINLGVAANTTCHDLMTERLTEHRKAHPFNPESLNYFQFEGTPRLRNALAQVFNERILRSDVKAEADDFIVGNGCGPLLEHVVSVLADEHDCVLIPSPYYHAFSIDVTRRMQCQIKGVPLTWNEETKRMSLSMETVEECYQECLSKGKKVPIFIYTNPHNPCGTIFTTEETEALVSWCLSKQVHLISDEIYALSIFSSATTRFTSAWDVAHASGQRSAAQDLVHVMWGGSKDLGLNGFRIGVLLTRNKELKSCMRGLAYGFATASEVQELTAVALEDKAFMDKFTATNKERLTEAYTKVVEVLKENGVTDIAEAEGAMFVYFRMPGPELSLDEERSLWQRLVRENRVMALPGLVFDDQRRGWFRICVSANPLQDTLTAVKRIFHHKK